MSLMLLGPHEDGVDLDLPPRGGVRPLQETLRHIVARERTVLSVRRARPGATIRRLAAPEWRPGRARNTFRSVVLGGILVDLPERRRLIDDLLDVSGFNPGGAAPRLSADGSLLFVGSTRKGLPAVLRAAPAGSPGDPARAADGLEKLEAASVEHVPRLMGRGIHAGASWSLETRLEGRPPRRLAPTALRDLRLFVGSLPRVGAPGAHAASAFASVGDLLGRPLPVPDLLGALPPVMAHGDLWQTNVLVAHKRLVGVVDWSDWQQGGTPGLDVIQLAAGDRFIEVRSNPRAAAEAMPWRSPPFAELLRSSWNDLGIEWAAGAEDHLGAAWWIGRVASAISRFPDLRHEVPWRDRVAAGARLLGL